MAAKVGKRGPARTPDHVLALRGTRRGVSRSKKNGKPAPAMMFHLEKPRPIGDLNQIILEIPGYDPHVQAGDCVFDEGAAKHAIQFFENELSHLKGEMARTPFLLERWQQAIMANLFGWKRPNGTRRYRQCLIYIPRKNGKTFMAAAIIVYCLFEDGEPCAEIYGAASEYGQASLVFDHAFGMVRQNQYLADRCKVYMGQSKAIQLTEDYSTYRVVASNAGPAHGFNTHVYIVDELHVLPNSDLVDALQTSTGARRQPLGIFITTADFEREGSPCNEKHDYATQVRDNEWHDPAFLPVIYEAAYDCDWTDVEVWRKANPNFDVSVSEEHLADECAKAQKNPRYENTFKRLHLNIRTTQYTRWISMESWDQCVGEVDEAELEGCECYGGLDLAPIRDLSAFVLVFPVGDRFKVLSWFWMPLDNLQQRERDENLPYLQWQRDGFIHATPGNVTDMREIPKGILECNSRYNIRQIAFDKAYATEVVRTLMDAKIEMSDFRQTIQTFTEPTQRLEALINSGKIEHGGNPVLRANASVVQIYTDCNQNYRPVKSSTKGRIDGIVALIMAVSRATRAEGKRPSMYARGVSM